MLALQLVDITEVDNGVDVFRLALNVVDQPACEREPR